MRSISHTAGTSPAAQSRPPSSGARPHHGKPTEVLFLSDLDGTWLSKDPVQRKALEDGVLELRDEYRPRGIDLKFGYVTARSPELVSEEHLPKPDRTITYNGGYIQMGPPGEHRGASYHVNKPLQDWDDINHSSHFSTKATDKALDELLAQPEYRGLKMRTVGEVVHSPSADANPYVGTYCFDESSIRLTPAEQADKNRNGIPDIFEARTMGVPRQLAQLRHDLDEKLTGEAIHHELSPVYPFHGKPLLMFDASSPTADKGHAVQFLMEHDHVVPDHLIIAGDGGNDIAMMRPPGGGDDGRRAIVVGGEKTLREAAAKLAHTYAAPPKQDSAAGVLAGLKAQLKQIAAED